MSQKLLHDSEVARVDYAKVNGNVFLLFSVKKLKSETQDFGKLCEDLAGIYVKLHQEGIQFAQIYDLTNIKITNVYNETIFVKSYGDYLDNYAEILTESCHGTALIIESDFVRSLIKMGLSWYTHRKPTEVKGSSEEAYKWLLDIIPSQKNVIASE